MLTFDLGFIQDLQRKKKSKELSCSLFPSQIRFLDYYCTLHNPQANYSGFHYKNYLGCNYVILDTLQLFQVCSFSFCFTTVVHTEYFFFQKLYTPYCSTTFHVGPIPDPTKIQKKNTHEFESIVLWGTVKKSVPMNIGKYYF